MYSAGQQQIIQGKLLENLYANKKLLSLEQAQNIALLITNLIEHLDALALSQGLLTEYAYLKRAINHHYDLSLPIEQSLLKNYSINKMQDNKSLLKAFEGIILNELARKVNLEKYQDYNDKLNYYNRNFCSLVKGALVEENVMIAQGVMRLFNLTWMLLRKQAPAKADKHFLRIREGIIAFIWGEHLDKKTILRRPSSSASQDFDILSSKQKMISGYGTKKGDSDEKGKTSPYPKKKIVRHPGKSTVSGYKGHDDSEDKKD